MLPAVVSGGAILYRAATGARAAMAAVTLPAARSGWPAIRSAMTARLGALYSAIPSTAKTVITTVAVSAGISGVTTWATGLFEADKDDVAFATLLINLANQGVNPDFVAPPEYVAKLDDSKLKSMFENARAAYAAYMASHGGGSEFGTDNGLESSTATFSDVEVVREIAAIFGAHTSEAIVERQAVLKAFLALPTQNVVLACQMVKAAGGRL